MASIRRYKSKADLSFDEVLKKRRLDFSPEVINSVSEILDTVRTGSDRALLDYAQRFDGAKFRNTEEMRVTQREIDDALKSVPSQDRESLEYAAQKIRDFHARVYKESWFTTDEHGSFVGSKVSPLKRVGIYVPGGRAFYPSTVLMNAMPAQVAGVKEIVMVTPSRDDGSVHPVTLLSAHIAGVTEIYKVGGAHSIAALAYGTDTIAPVDKIVGPGNNYVAAAKYLVQGEVAIDMIAGPSEVLIIADDSADPRFVAIDLMAQAEHDPNALTYLVSTDTGLFDSVEFEIEQLLQRSNRREVTEESLRQNCYFIKVNDLSEAVACANDIAPEHLEVQTIRPLDLLGSIQNAGAIFLGHYSPESVGDYIAGPNHVLPTSGTARFASPLSTEDFVKRSSVIHYTPKTLLSEGEHVERIAAMEGLWAHGEAVSMRLDIIRTSKGM